MKQISLLALSRTLSLGVLASYPDGYYSKMNGKQKEALKQAAKESVQKHTVLVYTDLPTYWQYSDVALLK